MLPSWELARVFYNAMDDAHCEIKAFKKLCPEKCVADINTDIGPFAFELRPARSETAGGAVYFVLSNRREDAVSKEITPMGADAYVGFKNVAQILLEDGDMTWEEALKKRPDTCECGAGGRGGWGLRAASVQELLEGGGGTQPVVADELRLPGPVTRTPLTPRRQGSAVGGGPARARHGSLDRGVGW